MRSRNVRGAVEKLEGRVLLTVTPAEYSAIRSMYPEFGLPASRSAMNVIEIAPGDLSVAKLKDAIASAGQTDQDDLVVVRTTDTQNRITYGSSADELKIMIPSAKGQIAILGFGSQPLTIDAAQKSRVMSIGSVGERPWVALGDLVLTGGDAGVDDGGGILAKYSRLVLTHCTIAASEGDLGGGVNLWFSQVDLADVAIEGNTAVEYGGGLWSGGSDLVMTNVAITGNQATWHGGGGLCIYAGATVGTNVVLRGNTAWYAGGLMVDAGVILRNSEISGNTSGSDAGAIYVDSRAALVLNNVTLAANVAQHSGGGLYAAGGTTTLQNTIVALNSAGSGPDLYQDSGIVVGQHALIGNGTGQTGIASGADGNQVGTSAEPIDPQFVSTSDPDRARWDLRLQPNSPAMNAGDIGLLPTGINTDLDGNTRLVGLAVDLGAYEQQQVTEIAGTDWNDRIRIELSGGAVNVVVNGNITAYPLARMGLLVVRGGGGDDTIAVSSDLALGVSIYGGGGNDSIVGGDGSDLIEGGEGDDTLIGGGGNDTIHGHDGADRIEGGAGEDELYGNAGNDTLYGGGGNDVVFGQGGDDALYGNFGDDTMNGGDGADELRAGLGADSMAGGMGNDSLYGGDGVDTISGDGGDDYIEARGKADTIYGGSGNDVIWGGAGSDWIDAGDGNDWVDSGSANVLFRDSVYGGAGEDTVRGNAGDLLESVEVMLG